MPPSFIIRSLLVLGAITAASSEELSFLDLRVGGGVLSRDYRGASSTTVTNNSSSVSTTTESGDDGRDAERHYRGQLQLVWGNLGPAGGLILGGGIAFNSARFDNSAQDADLNIPVVDVLIGYGFAINRAWHFELTPFAGVGRAYYTVTDQGSTTTSKDWSKYVEYGARIGAYYTFAESLQAGIEVPYLIGRLDPEYDHDSNPNTYSVSDSRRNQGLGLLISLGHRF